MTLLRVGMSLVFLFHGSQKAFGFFQGKGIGGTASMFEALGIGFAYPVAVFVSITEILCGLSLLVGFLTRVAAVGVILIMAGAIQTVHVEHGFDFAQGGYEYNALLIVISLALLLSGGGALSLDRLLEGRESCAAESLETGAAGQ